jgi:eukaryotic-like serine/threonine-protein kinase
MTGAHDFGPLLGDRYDVERELGHGGMATVYLAQDRKHGRPVAIKVLHPELSAVLGTDRFLAEIALTASLQHPHIVGLIDSGTADGRVYYVMPYIGGESLRRRLEREKQLPLRDTLRIATEVADALEYAHQRGLVHRDIKPENILLQGEHASVADFGIALAVQQAGGSRLTQTGLSLGTPQYMSPEQASGERDLGPRSDVWALGAVTHEMLTGEPPFTGATAQGVLARVLSEDPTPPSARRRSVPPSVDRAVLTALERLPADRYASCAEFARALNAPFPADHSANRPGVSRWSRAVLALGVLGAVAGYLLGHRAPPERVSGDPPLRRFTIMLPDTAPLAIGTGRPVLAIAPDGGTLVYVGRVQGENRVLARDLRTDSVRALPGGSGATGPVVSPSGRVAAFWVGPTLVSAEFAGGHARTIERVTVVTRGTALLSDSTAAVASDPNGTILAVPLQQPVTRESLVWLTGRPELTNDSHAWPEVLPGGGAILYAIANGEPSSWSIAVRALPDGDERILVEGGSQPRYARSGHLVFLREDALWAVPFDVEKLQVRGRPVMVQPGVLTEPDGLAHYAVSAEGTLVYAPGGGWRPARRVVWVSPTGAVEAAPLPPAMYESVALAPDGRRIALATADGSNHDVALGDLRRGTLVPLTRDPGEDGSPVWSADGRRLAYATEQWGGAPKAAIADLVLGGSHLAADTNYGFSGPTSWGRDGRLFLTTASLGLGPTRTGSDIVVLEQSGRRVWQQTAADEGRAAISPDGRWVAYVSNETGRDQVYLRSSTGEGTPVPVSTDGGTEPRWGRTTGRLYFRRGDRILMVALTVGGATPDLSVPITFLRLGPGIVTEAGFNGSAWDIAPDERRVVAVEDTRHLHVTTLQVVLNWFAELDRLAPAARAERGVIP